jgi:hypothetical protein
MKPNPKSLWSDDIHFLSLFTKNTIRKNALSIKKTALPHVHVITSLDPDATSASFSQD